MYASTSPRSPSSSSHASAHAALDQLDFTTLCIHADDGIENNGDLSPPLHLATTFVHGNDDGLSYSRAENMTRRRLEAVLATLEASGTQQGAHAVTYASGMAAVMAVLSSFKPRRIIIHKYGYKGTHSAIDLYCDMVDKERIPAKQLDANTTELVEVLPLDDMSSFEKLRQNDLVWIESPLNPTSELSDIAKLAELAHKKHAIVVVDNTFASPVLQRPLQLGADIVMHSATKFLGGHSDLLGGVLVATGGRAYKLLSDRTTMGNVMGNMEAWLLLRSLRTLTLRVRQQSTSAKKLAQWLEANGKPKIKQVFHPSLKSSHNKVSYDLCKQQMSGPPPILSIVFESQVHAEKFPSLTKLFKNATSLGGVESTLDWRLKYDSGIEPGLVRVSVGLEDPQDLMADLAQALKLL